MLERFSSRLALSLSFLAVLAAVQAWPPAAKAQVVTATQSQATVSTSSATFTSGQATFVVINPIGSAATTTSSTSAPSSSAAVAANVSIGGNPYQVANLATFAKTASGLQVTLSPGTLSGTGTSAPLAGHTEGLTLLIPTSFINQLFF